MKTILSTTKKLSRNYTDCLKIVSALLVVSHHYSQLSIVHGWSSSPVWWALASQGGYIGVAIFFFLSGYGLSESDKKRHLPLSDFVKRRFLKIYLPVLLVTAIWIPLEFAFFGKPLNWGTLPYDLLWGFDDDVLWFVRILFGLYVAFFIFSELMARKWKSLAWGILILASLSLMGVMGFSDFGSAGIPCFGMGVLYSHTRKLLPSIAALSIGICVGLTYTFLTKDYSGVYAHAVINYIVLAIVLLLYAIVPYIDVVLANAGKCLPLCAAFTFDLYITHWKVLDTLISNHCLRKSYRGG